MLITSRAGINVGQFRHEAQIPTRFQKAKQSRQRRMAPIPATYAAPATESLNNGEQKHPGIYGNFGKYIGVRGATLSKIRVTLRIADFIGAFLARPDPTQSLFAAGRKLLS